MEPERLVKMANDIANFFKSEPDHQVRLEGIAGHIRRFWDPRMRRAILAWLQEHGGEGLDPLAREALQTHLQMLTPAATAGS